jgi:hypothetical protein
LPDEFEAMNRFSITQGESEGGLAPRLSRREPQVLKDNETATQQINK